MCSAPKFGENEERTGLGGGYNERDEQVEYIHRDDSDDEYDDFGRKKKKIKLQGSSRGPDRMLTQNRSSQDGHRDEESKDSTKSGDGEGRDRDDEDEDDDEEDGDVSKYKLESEEEEEDEEEDDGDEDLSKYDLSDCLEDKK